MNSTIKSFVLLVLYKVIMVPPLVQATEPIIFPNNLILDDFIGDRSLMDVFGRQLPAKDAGQPPPAGLPILLSGDCSDYEDLTGLPLPISVEGSTVGAANDYGPYDARPFCWDGDWWSSSGAAPDVTYKWTVPADGRYTISLCGSSYETVLQLYDFTCPVEPSYPDDFICGNDDLCGNQSEITGFWFGEGQEILIVVDGYGNYTGSYNLEISVHETAPIDSFIVNMMEPYQIPGLSACIVKEGEIVWTGSYGHANFERDIDVADTTLFMLGSVSKTITGTALMQLYEDELFGLDENINDYLPPELQVHNPYYPDDLITFRMLLTHTSSINDNWQVLNSLLVFGDSPIPLNEFLEDYLVPGGAYYNPSQNFNDWPPGSQWAYCNVAIALSAYLVSTIRNDGTSFDEHCQDSIFIPLEMNETSWFFRDLNANNIAMPYEYYGGAYHPFGHYGYPDYPDGQLRTSVLQLARFLIAFMQGGQIGDVRILDNVTVDLMTSIQVDFDPPDYIFRQGLIWHYMNWHGRWVWGHTGGDIGVATFMMYEPEENWGVIAFTNGDPPAQYNDGFFFMLVELLEFAAGWPYGFVTGVVDNESNNPIEGAFVEAAGTSVTDYSNIDGEYFLNYLSPGTYDISFSHPDYLDTTITGILITAGDTAILNVELRSVCDYVIGDYNNSGAFNVADIVDGYSRLKTGLPEPAFECECPPGSGNEWAVAMDVNNSCAFNVADIVDGYSKLKTGSPELEPCEECPPPGF
jgi:CubicO group peptidase (beta-lactamase class C family)